MFLIWFDIDNKVMEKEHVAIENISNDMFNLGLKFDAVKINSAEHFFRWYARKKGYDAIRCTAENKETLVSVMERFNFKRSDVSNLMETGIPDFLIFNQTEFCFVEMKTHGDGIRYVQLLWAFKHKVPLKYCWVILGQYEICEDESKLLWGCKDLKVKNDGQSELKVCLEICDCEKKSIPSEETKV